MKNETILAIESAVGGGSLALIADRHIASSWHGTGRVSRAEELLKQISEMLKRENIDRRDLSRIAVSNGPGSYTGIRIGLATAMGLSRALAVPCRGIFLLDALELRQGSSKERLFVVPIGRNGYCWRYWEAGTAEPRDPSTGGIAELLADIEMKSNVVVYAQRDAFDDLRKAAAEELNGRLLDLGRDLAVAVGLASTSIDSGLAPFYAREPAYQSRKIEADGNA